MSNVDVTHDEMPMRNYILVWFALVVLTGLTVGVTFLDMKDFAVFTAVLIATIKAALVLLYFMHLRHAPISIIAIVLVAMLTLAIFMVGTFADVLYLYQ